MTTTLFDLDRDELAIVLEGEPSYRVDQVWDGLHRQLRAVDDLTTVPKRLRARLTEQAPTALTLEAESVSDGGDTRKLLWRLGGDASVETVLMLYPDRATVCVSTQAGCAMGCTFCATGQAGFERHLSVGEIVEQVIEAARRAAPTSRVEHRLHGDGRAARQLRRHVGARSSGSTTPSASRPGT